MFVLCIMGCALLFPSRVERVIFETARLELGCISVRTERAGDIGRKVHDCTWLLPGQFCSLAERSFGVAWREGFVMSFNIQINEPMQTRENSWSGIEIMMASK